jgi:hypothetical protein
VLIKHVDFLDPTKSAVAALSIVSQYLFDVADLDKIGSDSKDSGSPSLLKPKAASKASNPPGTPAKRGKKRRRNNKKKNKSPGRTPKGAKQGKPAPFKVKVDPVQDYQGQNIQHPQSQNSRGGFPKRGGGGNFRRGGQGRGSKPN